MKTQRAWSPRAVGKRRSYLSAWVVISIVAVVYAASCGGGEGDSSISEEQARAVLPQMVLQQGDVPETLEPTGERFTTNEELAGPGIGVRPGAEQIEEWGRVLGYARDFQAASVGSGPPVIGINSTASLYQKPDGAAGSFSDVARQARETNWAVFYDDLSEFEVREVDRDVPVDDLLWLRLSGSRPKTSEPGSLFVADDQIIYRVGGVRGYLRVLTSQEDTNDRDLALERAEALLRTQVQRTRDALDSLE